MSGKREFFDDFINNLFQVELKIVKNLKPKLHESEQEIFDDVYNQIATKGHFAEDKPYEKRIKNRLKNKIVNFLDGLDIELLDKDLRKDLVQDISFYNINSVKKRLRQLIKRKTNIDNIHSFLLLMDELRKFFYKVKEQNEIKTYYDVLEDNMDMIDTNLAASYFLRELDLNRSKKDGLSSIEKKVRKIQNMLENNLLIDGYRFRLSKILCEHKINTKEWEDAKQIALTMERDIQQGRYYSKENIARLYSLLVRIYNQTYDEQRYEYYLEELGKSNEDTGFLEKQILSLSTKMNSGSGFVSKEMLGQAERLSQNSDSERIKIFLRMVRTQYHIQNKEFGKAKSYNDIFFVDIHNSQVREFLDQIYIHRFIILFNQNRFDDVVNLFNNKITQRRFLTIERKGQMLIYPYIIYDLCRFKVGDQDLETTFSNVYRMLDFYQYSNFLGCYAIIRDCIRLILDNVKLEERQDLKLRQLNKVVEETLGNM